MNKIDPLIRTKLRLPFTRSGLVFRPRLQERMAQGLRGPLTLIVAPAGYGKTTLVACCIAGCGMPVAWLSLDKDDNHVGRFLAYLLAALQEVDSDLGKEAVQLLAISPQTYPETILASLINDLDARKRDFAQDAWIESYRAARIPSSLEMWTKAGVIVEAAARLRVLGLACGCSIKTLVLAQKSPGVQVTCLDQPLVLEAARDLAERWSLLPQVRWMPDNLLTADLGKAHYDACLLGQVSHYLTEQQNRDLFSRISRALIPDGKLVLDVPMETEQPDENSSFLSLVLWANSGGRAYAIEEYRTWLLDAGFEAVYQLSPRLLSAQR